MRKENLDYKRKRANKYVENSNEIQLAIKEIYIFFNKKNIYFFSKAIGFTFVKV